MSNRKTIKQQDPEPLSRNEALAALDTEQAAGQWGELYPHILAIIARGAAVAARDASGHVVVGAVVSRPSEEVCGQSFRDAWKVMSEAQRVAVAAGHDTEYGGHGEAGQ